MGSVKLEATKKSNPALLRFAADRTNLSCNKKSCSRELIMLKTGLVALSCTGGEEFSHTGYANDCSYGSWDVYQPSPCQEAVSTYEIAVNLASIAGYRVRKD